MMALSGLPRVSIEIDGSALEGVVAQTLVALRVQQRLSCPTLCELTWSGTLDPSKFPCRPGAALRIIVAREPLFVGELTALTQTYGPTGERQIRVRGYDALHRLRKRRPVRAHTCPNLMDVIAELTSDLGIGIEAGDDVDRAMSWRYLIQHRQSDLELLTELTEACGVFFTLRDRTLQLVTLQGIDNPIRLVVGDSLAECTFELNGDPACRSVSARGWHPSSGRDFQGRASRPRSAGDLSDEVAPARFGADGERVLVDQCAETSEQLDAVSQAELDRQISSERHVVGTAGGDPKLRPGARVELRGISDTFTGTYVITSVDHTIDANRGFLSTISSAPPERRPAPAPSAVSVASVTDVRDPEKLGRVRVELSAFCGVESDWMQVLSAGAGSGKGWMIVPDVGDRVLVLLAHGDPAQGVVVGGLYGDAGPFDSGVNDEGVQRYSLLTRSGHKVKFDDENKVIRIESATGSHVELAPDHLVIHAAGNLTLEAPGKAVVIRGKSVDFRRG